MGVGVIISYPTRKPNDLRVKGLDWSWSGVLV